MLSRPAVPAKGAYSPGCALMGVALHGGVTLAQGRGRRARHRPHLARRRRGHTPCDAIGFGHGLRSETQLADLAGCAFDLNEIDQALAARRDAAGRSSVPRRLPRGRRRRHPRRRCGGAGPAHAPHSTLWRRPRRACDARAPAAHTCAGPAHARAPSAAPSKPPFPSRRDWAAEATDDLIVCRCEEITAGELRACGATPARASSIA